MSYPVLYSATETQFNHNGLGILGDCAGYEVFSEGNGPYDLTMLYPVDGIHFDEISDRSIIKAKFDKYTDPQLFRVKTINKSTSGLASVYAEHISYDLSGIPVSPFSAPTASSALEGLKNNAATECPFDFWTDKETQANFKVSVPSSIRSRLGGVAGSILDVYGGEYEFDNYTVKLYKNRGKNRGFSIRYGKNLTDIQQDRNCANVATGIYPYWVSAEGSDLVELPEKIVYAAGTYNFQRIITVDFSQEFEQQPTVEELRERAERYVEENDIGVPIVSLSVSFEQLSKSEEYKHLALLERVSLFDIVNVEFPALGVSATAKVVKIVYDGLTERIKTVTLGSVRSNIADTIANQSSTIEQNKTETRTQIQKAQEAATSWLTNGKGCAYFRKDDLGNIVDILFMDTQDAETAVNVMRVGQSGIGFSHNGVDGPYESAWTIDGNFVADFITTGSLNANLIKTGTINSASEKFSLSLDGGNFKFSTDSGAYIYMDGAGIQYGKIVDGEDVGKSRIWMQPTFINISTADGVSAALIGLGGTRIGYDGSDTSILGKKVLLTIDGVEKELSWKDNSDGTFSLIGR